MNLHLLRIFVAVATEQSFSRAAATLHISQPAVSKGIVSLERQLGLTLLDRSHNLVTLTEAGQVLFPHAQALFAEERTAEAALARVRDVTLGHLALGASSTVGIYLLPPLIAEYCRHHPNIIVTLDIGNTHDLVQRMRTTPLDAILVEGPVVDPELTIIPWREDQLMVIAAPGHPLQFHHHLPAVALADDIMLLREAGSGTREIIDAHLQTRGVRFARTMEIGHTEAIKRLVAEGLGVGIVPAISCQEELAAGQLIALDVPDLLMVRYLGYMHVANRPLSPAHQAFRDRCVLPTAPR